MSMTRPPFATLAQLYNNIWVNILYVFDEKAKLYLLQM